MKIWSASLLAATFASVAFASPTLTKRNLAGTHVRRSIDKRMIMEKAIPVDKAGKPRKLENNNNFQLTSAYSLQFNTCVSLTLEPSDDSIIFSQSLVNYTAKGLISPQKSYILFNVCETKYCDYFAADDNLYLVDIATYMSAISSFYVARKEVYCEACVNSYNYCSYYKANKQYLYEEQASSAYQLTQNGGNRRLFNGYEMIDCDVCEDMQCFYEIEQQQAQYQAQQSGQSYYQGEYQDTIPVDLDSIADWVDGVTQCHATETSLFDTYPLYAGFMCNQDGSGVDIALFLDQYCTVYTATQSFQKIASYEDQVYMYEATDLIKYPFTNKISCNGNAQYLSYQDYKDLVTYSSNGNNGNNNNNNNNNQAGEASEFCRSLFEGGQYGKAQALNDCNNDEEEDVESEYLNEYKSSTYSFYSYILTQDDAKDLEATCKIIQTMEGEYKSVYRWSGSGQLYNYGTGPQGTTTENIRKYFSEYSYEKMDATLIAAIVVAVFVALTAFACILWSCCSSSSAPNQYEQKSKEYDDDKKEKLVDESTGRILT